MSTEPSGALRAAAGPGHVADEAVRGAVVDRRRPVLVHRRVRGYGEAITLAAVEILPAIVLDVHQIELAIPEMFGREEGEYFRDAKNLLFYWVS